MGSAFDRGRMDCMQDRCENAPFGSVGGLDARASLAAPDYVPEADRAEYLRGYEHAAAALFGDDWRTCRFGWQPALVISGDEEATDAVL